MAGLSVQSDVQLATLLAQRESGAIGQFSDRFAVPLRSAFDALCCVLRERHPPGCRQQQPALVPHVGGAAGEGYLKHRPSDDGCLDEHVSRLVLSDLFHAAACLRHDESACLRLLRIVDQEVAPPLVRKFSRRLSPGRAQEIVDNLLSHLWSPSTPTAADESPGSDGPRASAPAAAVVRLERYLGLATLRSWLYSMARHLLLDASRAARNAAAEIPLDEPQGIVAAARGGLPDEHPDTAELVHRYGRILRTYLDEALRLFQSQKNPRLAHVAWMWLPYRTQRSWIAQLLGITKARVSQLAAQILDALCAAAHPACRALSESAEIPLRWVQAALRANPHHFFPPLLLQRVVAALRALQSQRPEVAHVAFLLGRQRDVHDMADQLGDSLLRVRHLLDELRAWQRETAARIAAELCEESGVPLHVAQARADGELRHTLGAAVPPGTAPLTLVE
jgi:hypothetical protein